MVYPSVNHALKFWLQFWVYPPLRWPHSQATWKRGKVEPSCLWLPLSQVNCYSWGWPHVYIVGESVCSLPIHGENLGVRVGLVGVAWCGGSGLSYISFPFPVHFIAILIMKQKKPSFFRRDLHPQ